MPRVLKMHDRKMYRITQNKAFWVRGQTILAVCSMLNVGGHLDHGQFGFSKAHLTASFVIDSTDVAVSLQNGLARLFRPEKTVRLNHSIAQRCV